MSRKRIRRPKKGTRRQDTQSVASQQAENIPALNGDTETLTAELARLQQEIEKCNKIIREATDIVTAKQQEIEGVRAQGLQVIGQATTIQRLLVGQGVEIPPPGSQLVPQASAEGEPYGEEYADEEEYDEEYADEDDWDEAEEGAEEAEIIDIPQPTSRRIRRRRGSSQK